MSTPSQSTTRRQFLKTAAVAAGTAAVAGIARPGYAAEDNTIRIALIGCGGRGTGAAQNALNTKFGPTKLVAMADVFENRLNGSFNELSNRYREKVDVADRKFAGFDAYKQAMDCLKPGDIAIFASPPAFRWVHFGYAVEKGLNVFMEKPITVDGPTSKRMLQQAEQAGQKNLKVGVGLMSRHSRALQELHKRVSDGELGEILLMRGYRMHGPVGYFASLPKSGNVSHLRYQVQRFHSFLWASGGNFSDFYIHIIDHLSWMKNAWPVRAQALGGRHYRQDNEGRTFVDQNFDTYSVEYTFADGTKFYFDGRCMNGCRSQYNSAMHGTKGLAIASRDGDCGQPSAIYKTQLPSRANLVWESKAPPGEGDPYQNEWNDLIEAIRKNQPYNEAKYGIEASLVTSMGRMAAHTGQEISYNDILNGDHEFAPGLDKCTEDFPAPLQPDAQNRYPVPEPGRKGTREY